MDNCPNGCGFHVHENTQICEVCDTRFKEYELQSANHDGASA